MDSHVKTISHQISIIVLSCSFFSCWPAHAEKSIVSDFVIERSDFNATVRVNSEIVCRVHGLDRDYWPGTPVRVSSDGQSVIFSSTQYAFYSDLKSCGGRTIKSRSINRKSAALIDINAAKKLFLSIDVVYASPFAYIATFGRLDGTGLNFHPPGSWMGSLKKAVRQSFGADQDDPKGKISANGRYIAASNAEHCADYPGVWDLEKRKQVIFMGKDPAAVLKKCKELFMTS